MTKIAFLGLGIMGGGMAARLVAAGFDVTVYNRDPAKTKGFQGKARIAANAADAAAGADIVFAMLSDDRASRALWLDGGALGAARSGAVLVECSTLSLDWGRQLAAAAAAKGCSLVDAPVTGSKVQAAEGALKFLVGGAEDAVETARPAFAAMGSEVIRMGPPGSGITMKLVNNFLCGVQVASLAEALTMAERAGLDVEQARGVLMNGAPGSPLLKLIAARIAARDYTPNFFTALMAKDLGYAADEAKALGLELASATAARNRFLAAAEAGYGEQDMASVIEPLRKT
jgi:3-hydroxyisobutyrate dehydrogenase